MSLPCSHPPPLSKPRLESKQKLCNPHFPFLSSLQQASKQATHTNRQTDTKPTIPKQAANQATQDSQQTPPSPSPANHHLTPPPIHTLVHYYTLPPPVLVTQDVPHRAQKKDFIYAQDRETRPCFVAAIPNHRHPPHDLRPAFLDRDEPRAVPPTLAAPPAFPTSVAPSSSGRTENGGGCSLCIQPDVIPCITHIGSVTPAQQQSNPLQTPNKKRGGKREKEENLPGNCPSFPFNLPDHHSLSFPVRVTTSITSPALKLRSPSACAA